jgi:hypothetical protein
VAASEEVSEVEPEEVMALPMLVLPLQAALPLSTSQESNEKEVLNYCIYDCVYYKGVTINNNNFNNH